MCTQMHMSTSSEMVLQCCALFGCLGKTVRMLCPNRIQGDLSEYSILVNAEGPMIIDFPQAVNAAGNDITGEMQAILPFSATTFRLSLQHPKTSGIRILYHASQSITTRCSTAAYDRTCGRPMLVQ
jgi:RIO-like serine/threonine protein kinase